jgi:hypothetical protein
MDGNPYAAPKASLDVPSPAETMARPPSVTLAVRLFAISIVLAPIRVGLFPPPRLTARQWMTGIVILGLLSLLLAPIWRGRSWARGVFAAFFLLGLPIGVPALISLVEERLVSGLLNLLEAVLQASALVLLFLPASRPWFRRRR